MIRSVHWSRRLLADSKTHLICSKLPTGVTIEIALSLQHIRQLCCPDQPLLLRKSAGKGLKASRRAAQRMWSTKYVVAVHSLLIVYLLNFGIVEDMADVPLFSTPSRKRRACNFARTISSLAEI